MQYPQVQGVAVLFPVIHRIIGWLSRRIIVQPREHHGGFNSFTLLGESTASDVYIVSGDSLMHLKVNRHRQLESRNQLYTTRIHRVETLPTVTSLRNLAFFNFLPWSRDEAHQPPSDKIDRTWRSTWTADLLFQRGDNTCLNLASERS
ncbi:hypothetical protein PLICRDRAFT_141173 [Plicaturopsis crispa FD-325 SS-3]|nr:hypothetical protein PLICRDRAFT_141173 [Plicaturopsis crispa FD-325 SS-3]